jgi:flagellar assembly protein FliH
MGSVVIKAGNVTPLAQGMYRLDLRDVASRIDEMVALARAESEEIVRAARERTAAEHAAALAAAQRRGYDEGYATGQAAGQAQGLETALTEARAALATQQAKLTQALSTALGEINARRESLYLDARRDVIVLAMAIASRVLGSLAIDADAAPAMAIQAAAEAIELVSGATRVQVRMHPEDAAALGILAGGDAGADSSLASVKQALTAGHVTLVEDAAIERGGVVVSTDDSEVDATVAGRIERIANELIRSWKQRAERLALSKHQA